MELFEAAAASRSMLSDSLLGGSACRLGGGRHGGGDHGTDPHAALQSAVPPFATDMYTPAFPQVTADLATTASLVGLTMTTFFLGMAAGQVLGGPCRISGAGGCR